MQYSIYKYTLKGKELETIYLPKNSKYLKAAMQGSCCCLWFLVPLGEEVEQEKRTFRTVGTGWIRGEDLQKSTYLDTVFDGSFVWHIFEVEQC